MVCATEVDECRLESAIRRLQQLSNRLNQNDQRSSDTPTPLEEIQEWSQCERRIVEQLERLETGKPTNDARAMWRVVRHDDSE